MTVFQRDIMSCQSPVDTIVYLTSLDKAIKVARDSNKFVRLYIVGPEICDAPNPLSVLQGMRLMDDYYTKEFLKKVVDDYVICVLPAYDAEVASRYEPDMMQPARLVLTKDGTLLYKEYGCNGEKSSLAYAHLLYANGDYDNALVYQKKALDAVSEAESPEGLTYREIKVEYELMKLRMLENE